MSEDGDQQEEEKKLNQHLLDVAIRHGPEQMKRNIREKKKSRFATKTRKKEEKSTGLLVTPYFQSLSVALDKFLESVEYKQLGDHILP